MSHGTRIALVSSAAATLPAPESEIPLVAGALGRAGLPADVVPWDAERDWAAYRLVVVRSPRDYVEHLTAFRAWVAQVEKVTRVVNPADAIRWNSHKGYLVELAAHGVATVPTTLIPGGSLDVAEQLDECGWDEVVIKPAVAGGGRSALRTARARPEALRHAQHLAHQGDVLVQLFVPGVLEPGRVSLVFIGGVMSHAVRNAARGGHRSREDGVGCAAAHEPTSPEVRTALSALAKVPGRLAYARVDLVEVNAVPSVVGLELIEADLFLRCAEGAVGRFVATLAQELDA